MTDDSLQRESFNRWYRAVIHSKRIDRDSAWEAWQAALSAQTEARDVVELKDATRDLIGATVASVPKERQRALTRAVEALRKLEPSND